MAKCTFQMPDEFLSKVSRLADKTDEIMPKVVEAGGGVVLAKVRNNLQSVVGSGTKEKPRSTGELLRSLGLSQARQDRHGDWNVKVGFAEPRSDGSSNAKIAKNVGVGFYATTIKDGTKKYRALWFKKVLFGIPNDAMETKGETISFKTVEIEGTIMGDGKGDWKEEQTFDTEAEAEAWLDEMADIKDEEEEEDSGE